MKPSQIIIRNQYTISPSGTKKNIIDNEDEIKEKIIEGYKVVSINTSEGNFNKEHYNNSAAKSLFISEIFILEYFSNI
jgi:hypothetical protein